MPKLPKKVKIGHTISRRVNVKGKNRNITWKKVNKYGKNKNLSWKIISNKPA